LDDQYQRTRAARAVEDEEAHRQRLDDKAARAKQSCEDQFLNPAEAKHNDENYDF
jgi:hypothetical protein